jgi:hypothetical protein
MRQEISIRITLMCFPQQASPGDFPGWLCGYMAAGSSQSTSLGRVLTGRQKREVARRYLLGRSDVAETLAKILVWIHT